MFNPRPYHVAWGLLGRGDLHPGGGSASLRLLEKIEPWRPGPVLELGAGIGTTTHRLRTRGWDVVAWEPDPRLANEHRRRQGVAPQVTGLGELAHRRQQWRGIVAESVLYAIADDTALQLLADAIEPGGFLGVNDLVWAPGTQPETSRRIHDASRERFGIALASAEPWSWSDWRARYERAGFRCVLAEPVPPAPRAAGVTILGVLGGAARCPGAMLDALRYEQRKRWTRLSAPLEPWMGVFRRE